MVKEENEIAALLKPRFKLIADYIGNSQPIGNITTEVTMANYYRRFTANFKELEWWEDLKPNEFPKYVKWIHGGIFEVANWRTNPNTAQLDAIYTPQGTLFINDLTPATEEEFLKQQPFVPQYPSKDNGYNRGLKRTSLHDLENPNISDETDKINKFFGESTDQSEK